MMLLSIYDIDNLIFQFILRCFSYTLSILSYWLFIYLPVFQYCFTDLYHIHSKPL